MRGLRRRLERLEAALRPPPEMPPIVIWYGETDHEHDLVISRTGEIITKGQHIRREKGEDAEAFYRRAGRPDLFEPDRIDTKEEFRKRETLNKTRE